MQAAFVSCPYLNSCLSRSHQQLGPSRERENPKCRRSHSIGEIRRLFGLLLGLAGQGVPLRRLPLLLPLPSGLGAGTLGVHLLLDLPLAGLLCLGTVDLRLLVSMMVWWLGSVTR